MARISSSDAAPISWLHVFGLIVVLWAVSSDSLAQARDLVVTEVRGTAVRSNSSAVRSLETLKVGERLRLSSDSRVCLFADQDANLYEIDGPAEVLLSPKGVLANGKPVEGRKLADAYRTRSGLTDVTTLVYPDARHEIFNETMQDVVRGDLLTWLDERFPPRD